MRAMTSPEIQDIQPGVPDAVAAPCAGKDACMQLPPPERRVMKHETTAFRRP